MKTCTLLILFTFFQVLFCKIEGITISKFEDAFDKSIPLMNEILIFLGILNLDLLN